LASARLIAARAATADILTIAEDHSFPDPNFAEELLAVFDSVPEVLAASPNMYNPNPGSPVSRAQFLLNHGIQEPVASDRRTEEVGRLPWHNTTYRRAAFLAAAQDAGLIQAEGLLQTEMRRQFPDGRFVHCHHTALWHVNMSHLAPAVGHAFHGGRNFGAERVGYFRWGWGTRLCRALVFPLVAWLKMVRCTPVLLRRPAIGGAFTMFVIACLLAFVHAFGEAVGILGGKGNSAVAYTRYECDRTGFVDPEERHLLVSTLSPTQALRGPQVDHAARPTA
jgi:hypothetical protein